MTHAPTPRLLVLLLGLTSGLAQAAEVASAADRADSDSATALRIAPTAPAPLRATDLAFGSEQEFLDRFGQHATRIAEGHYRITRLGVTYQIYFGRPALEASRDNLERYIRYLTPVAGKSLGADKAAELERLQQQHAKVQRDLLQPIVKQRYDSDWVDGCGFRVELQSDAAPGWVTGSASTTGTVSPGKSAADSLAFVEFSLYAIAGQPDYQGGLFGTPSISTVNFNTYSNTSSPPMAYAYTPGWQQCLRASGDAVVRRNPWFPDYCGTPIRVEAYSLDLNCPAGF